MKKETPTVHFTNGSFAERWIERTRRPGGGPWAWAAVCYRNEDTERTIWGDSERTGRLAFLRVWLWAARRYSPRLPVKTVDHA